jgi:hypothetical protein
MQARTKVLFANTHRIYQPIRILQMKVKRQMFFYAIRKYILAMTNTKQEHAGRALTIL